LKLLDKFALDATANAAANRASQSPACLPACRCPFAQRAWITLIEKKLNFEQKIVDLQNKPKHFKELYASIHPDPTAPAKVPIIIGESASASCNHRNQTPTPHMS